jgi:hypothetical protein
MAGDLFHASALVLPENLDFLVFDQSGVIKNV